MDKKKPPRGQREGLVSMAADAQPFTHKKTCRQIRLPAKRFIIKIDDGPQGSFAVTFYPQFTSHGVWYCWDKREAIAYGEILAGRLPITVMDCTECDR